MPKKSAPQIAVRAVDNVGEFAWIEKDELEIDPSYQRSLSEKHSTKFISEWSWAACGTLSVALRPDASWHVFDGQHRLYAAKQLPWITKLPCMTFEMETVPNEAVNFLDVNSNRRPMRTTEKFRALAMAEDPIAKAVSDVIVGSGRHIGTGSGPLAVACVQRLMDVMKDDRDLFYRLWPVWNELFSMEHKFSQDIITGTARLEKIASPGFSLTDKRWRRRLREVGVDKLNRQIRESGQYRGGRNPAACAEGVAIAINHGLHNKFQFTPINFK